jgi:hypothetical protein
MAEIISIEDVTITARSDEEFYAKAYAVASDEGAPHQVAHIYALEQFRYLVEKPFRDREQEAEALLERLAELKSTEAAFSAVKHPDAPVILLNGGIFEPIRESERPACEKMPGYKYPDDLRVCIEIAAELLRVRDAEGCTMEHDQKHVPGHLGMAGGVYAEYAYRLPAYCPALWPFSADFWKPKNPRADLIKGATLIVSEVVRFDREQEELRQANAQANDGHGDTA